MWNFKRKLYLLAIVTSLPCILYTSFFHFQNIQRQEKIEFDRLSEIAKLTATEHTQIQEGARQLLIALSTAPGVRSGSSSDCSIFLEKLITNYVRYSNFGVVNRQGQVRCAANNSQAQENPPSDDLVTKTIATNSFTTGSYYATKPNGAVINFAYPLSPDSIVYASLSLDWVDSFVNNLNTSPNLVINILDQHGTVLARSPQNEAATGQNFAADPLVQEILAKGDGQTAKIGIDQVHRLYSFSALDETHTTFIAAGIPISNLDKQKQQSLLLSLLTIIIITTISLVISYQTGQILIIRQIESLKELDKLKDEFTNLASHQIRSPLTAIRWLSEALLESTTSNKKVNLTVSKIHTTIIRLIELTSSLLHISRLESNSQAFQPKSVNLGQEITSVISELSPLAKRKKLNINTNLSSDTTINTDLSLFKEIIHILVSNAIKYSQNDSAILVSLKKSDQTAIIKVTDHGIGIPKHVVNKLFTRFYRADNARTYEPDGNGLGLYLASLITKKIGGKLSFQSTKSHTVFTLTLPNKL